ncbi:MAG: hypothetical protein AAGB19_16955 [Cyanobacteria bacterium P01_F01_bin.3]
MTLRSAIKNLTKTQLVIKQISGKQLLVALSLVLGTTACFPLANRSIPFHHARHNQALPNTPYSISLETDETEIETGRWLRADSLSLVHQETGEIFLVSTGSFLDKTAEIANCKDCITAIEAHGKTYFLTRFNGGGSGSFYFHDIVELTENEAIPVRPNYISCGQVFKEDDQLVFPSHEFKCPELGFSLESGSSRVETFLLE